MTTRKIPPPPTAAELEAQADHLVADGYEAKAAMLRRVAAALRRQENEVAE